MKPQKVHGLSRMNAEQLLAYVKSLALPALEARKTRKRSQPTRRPLTKLQRELLATALKHVAEQGCVDRQAIQSQYKLDKRSVRNMVQLFRKRRLLPPPPAGWQGLYRGRRREPLRKVDEETPLYKNNLWLVNKVAKRFLRGKNRKEKTDIISAGRKGLLRGIQLFDEQGRVKLSVHCSNWIWMYIMKHLRPTRRKTKAESFGDSNILVSIPETANIVQQRQARSQFTVVVRRMLRLHKNGKMRENQILVPLLRRFHGLTHTEIGELLEGQTRQRIQKIEERSYEILRKNFTSRS